MRIFPFLASRSLNLAVSVAGISALVVAVGIAMVESTGLVGAGARSPGSEPVVHSAVLYENDWQRDLQSGRVFKQSRTPTYDDRDAVRPAVERRPSRQQRRRDTGTYFTVCVRLCDGYFFPISTSTTRENFERDAEACSSQCAAPAKLFVYDASGGELETMTDVEGKPYSGLANAFLFRTKYSASCKCRAHPWEQQALLLHKTYASADWQKKARKLARVDRRKARRQRHSVAALRRHMERDFASGRSTDAGEETPRVERTAVVLGSTRTRVRSAQRISRRSASGRIYRPMGLGVGSRRATERPKPVRRGRARGRSWQMKILRPND